MEDSERLGDIIRSLSAQQLDFVAARMWTNTDAEAAIHCRISPNTAYNWDNKQDVNEAVRLAKMDGVLLAHEKLRRLVYRAIGVLEEEMAPRKRRRLDAAKEVLNRGGVDSPRRVELTGRDGGPIETRDASGITDEERVARIAAILDGARDRATRQAD